jgi:surface protein
VPYRVNGVQRFAGSQTNRVPVYTDGEGHFYVVANTDMLMPTSSISFFQGHSSAGFPNLIIINGMEYLDTRNVTTMERMFSDSQVISLDLSNFDTSKVTSMMSMFTSSRATSIDLRNATFDHNPTFTNMFWGSRTGATIYVKDYAARDFLEPLYPSGNFIVVKP